MRVLVAGIGNVFLGDDGFGVTVADRLGRPGGPALPEGVDVADFGIRGVHLAFELLDGRYDALVLVDAVPLGEPPGTVAVLDASERAALPRDADAGPVEAHSMSPDVVLDALHTLGGRVDRVLVVGCQPATLDEGMQLSPAVAAAVDGAVQIVHDTVRDLVAPHSRRTTPTVPTEPSRPEPSVSRGGNFR